MHTYWAKVSTRKTQDDSLFLPRPQWLREGGEGKGERERERERGREERERERETERKRERERERDCEWVVCLGGKEFLYGEAVSLCVVVKSHKKTIKTFKGKLNWVLWVFLLPLVYCVCVCVCVCARSHAPPWVCIKHSWNLHSELFVSSWTGPSHL